jgi:hypothetical protein
VVRISQDMLKIGAVDAAEGERLCLGRIYCEG